MAEPIEVARKHDEAFNARDVDARRDVEASAVEVVMPGGIALRGPEQVIAVVKAFWEAFSDVRIDVDSQLAAGEVVVVEGRLIGTHDGTFRAPNMEIAPTGRRINLRYAAVKRIQDDKLVSEDIYFDRMEFLQQLGAFPG